MVRKTWALVLAAALATGCAAHRPAAVVQVEPVKELTWQAIAAPGDQAAIAALPDAWAKARGSAGTRALRRMAREGRLLEAGAALDLPAPTPGPYLCRLHRIGGRASYRSYAPDHCYIDGDARSLSFTKQTGENLPGGWLYPDGERRLVFLGASRAPTATTAPAYGDAAASDVAGVVERVAPFRWRLVMTRAGGGALLDVYELVPIVPLAPPWGARIPR